MRRPGVRWLSRRPSPPAQETRAPPRPVPGSLLCLSAGIQWRPARRSGELHDAFVFAKNADANSEGVARYAAGGAFRPFHKQRAFIHRILEPQFINLRRILDPVEVAMCDLQMRRVIVLDKRETRTRYFTAHTQRPQNRAR